MGGVLLSGCGGSSLGPEIHSIDGDWTFTEAWRNSGIGISCENAGEIVIEQTDDIITGSLSQEGTCVDRDTGETFGTSADGSLRAGRVSGGVASFTAANCNYRGNIVGSPPDVLTGPVSCRLSSGGTTIVFSGTWHAMK